MALQMDFETLFFRTLKFFFLAVGEGFAMGGEAFYLAPSPLVSPLVSQTEHIFLRTHSM